MNVVMVHGSPTEKRVKEPDYKSNEESKHWQGWLKRNLEEKGIKCYSERMPTPWAPKYSGWKSVIDRLPVNEDTVLVGNSAGGAFLVRYIDEENKKVKKLILVSPGKAGWQSRKSLDDLYGDKTHENIKDLVKDQIIIITAEDDSESHIKSAHEYEKELNAKVIMFGKGYGHFTLEDMGTEEFPELLEEVLN